MFRFFSEVIKEYGEEIIKEKRFVFLLDDLNAFKSVPKAYRQILLIMIINGYTWKLLDIKKDRLQLSHLCSSFVRDFGVKENYAEEIFGNIAISIGCDAKEIAFTTAYNKQNLLHDVAIVIKRGITRIAKKMRGDKSKSEIKSVETYCHSQKLKSSNTEKCKSISKECVTEYNKPYSFYYKAQKESGKDGNVELKHNVVYQDVAQKCNLISKECATECNKPYPFYYKVQKESGKDGFTELKPYVVSQNAVQNHNVYKRNSLEKKDVYIPSIDERHAINDWGKKLTNLAHWRADLDTLGNSYSICNFVIDTNAGITFSFKIKNYSIYVRYVFHYVIIDKKNNIIEEEQVTLSAGFSAHKKIRKYGMPLSYPRIGKIEYYLTSTENIK